MTWRDKHPCRSCGEGYGVCAQGALLDTPLMCCGLCDHPGRWTPNPYTAAELREMWEGRRIPGDIQKLIDELEARK